MIWSQTLSLIVTGEMGWTPKLNRQGDRDPWNNLTPLVLASSGRKGDVIALWAAVHGYGLREAALDLARTFGLEPAPRTGTGKRHG